MPSVGERTIRDFGEQWEHYGDNRGFYGSVELLQDMLGPLIETAEIEGMRVADVGSGTGRIVRMLCDAGARSVIAVEPSAAAARLRDNTRDLGDRVQVIRGKGEALPPGLDLDLVISIGVVQFIPDPLPLLRAALSALRPGGRVTIWVYGKEGNGAYRLVLGTLRAITPRLPHAALDGLCAILDYCLDAYIVACRLLPLPLRDYLVNTFRRLDRSKRRLTIYDQLNPGYVKFYEEGETRALLEQAGFSDVRVASRRGYSWTGVGVRAL